MAKARAVWGIDVGHCALKALKLEQGPDDTVVVAGQDYIEHSKILSQPDAEPSELISKSLEKFLSRNDITEDRVVVSVPGQHTLARFSKLPPVDAKKIPDIVQFEANQQIPFDMDEVIWDYQAFSEEDSPEIEVGIFAMKRDLIHQHLAHFSDVGIEPVCVQSAPLAVYDAMAFDGRLSEETTVLLDIGAENTDLVITDGVRIWTRTIPIGGNNFTDALASGFKLSFSKAENLKRQASTSKYARQIFQAMRPVFADLVGEIQRSIGFYTSTHREAKLDRIVGLGNAFKLPGLQKFLQQNLGIKVAKPGSLKKAGNLDAFHAKQKSNVLGFAVAYGLALEGIGQGRMTNNLLPPEIARQVIWRRKRPWFAASAACLLVAALLVHWRFSADMGRLTRGEAGAPPSVNFDRARQMVENGIPDSGNPRAFAQQVLAVGKAIQGEYNKRKGEGISELEECRAVVDLLRGRDVWPQIIPLVHGALPAPPTALAAAKSGPEYVQSLVGNEALVRTKRPEVFIDAFESEYVEDIYADDYRKQKEDLELFDYYTTEEPPTGFVITLECTTPNEERGKFVEREFIRKLEQSGRDPDIPFYFDGVRLIGGLNEAVRSGPSGRGGRGAAGPSPTRARGGVDPLTHEDTSQDWRFQIKFVVALTDLPEEESPGTPKVQDRQSGRGGRG